MYCMILLYFVFALINDKTDYFSMILYVSVGLTYKVIDLCCLRKTSAKYNEKYMLISHIFTLFFRFFGRIIKITIIKSSRMMYEA